MGKNKKAEKWQQVTAQQIADTVDESWITEHARQVCCKDVEMAFICLVRLPDVYQGGCV